MSEQELVPGGLANFLRSVPYQISGQWYHQKNIMLDGFAFSNCRFDSCNIFLSHGPFTLDHCYMSGCTIFYNDEALAAVRFFVLNHLPRTLDLPPRVKAVFNADGTFSIDSQPR